MANSTVVPRIPASSTANGATARRSSAVTEGSGPWRIRATASRNAITAAEEMIPAGGVPMNALAPTRAAHWVATTPALSATMRGVGEAATTTTRTATMLTINTGRLRMADQ